MSVKPHIPFVEFPMDTLDLNILYPLSIKASLILGRYDGILRGILNPNVLLSPLTSNEAILSSRIEGTIASLSEVLEYEAGKKDNNAQKTQDIKEILNYRKALTYAKEEVVSRDLSMSLIKELHSMLLDNVRGQDKTPGKVRTEQNLIGKHGDNMQTARFIPPAPEQLSGALYNFDTLIKNPAIDSLILLAIVHAQFEILHPFMDGNGRLGRMLIPLFLFKRDIIYLPSFYMSAYLEKNDTEYRDRLLAITKDNDWQGWCKFFLNGLAIQAQDNINRAENIRILYESMKQEFTDATQSPSVIGALDAFFKYPIINSTNFMKVADIMTRETANSILKKLVDKGLIDIFEQGSGRKPSTYVMASLLLIADGELDLTQKS